MRRLAARVENDYQSHRPVDPETAGESKRQEAAMSAPATGSDKSLAMEILAAAMTGVFDRTDSLLEWMLLERPAADGAGGSVHHRVGS